MSPDPPGNEEEFATGADLPSTSHAVASRIFSLPNIHVSSAQREFPYGVGKVISSAFSASAAPGSARTYET